MPIRIYLKVKPTHIYDLPMKETYFTFTQTVSSWLDSYIIVTTVLYEEKYESLVPFL